MENILLRYCRETNGIPVKMAAAKIGVAITEYTDIENGNQLITEEQAKGLGNLYKVDWKFIYDAALQLDLLLAQNAIIIEQREKIERQRRQLIRY